MAALQDDEVANEVFYYALNPYWTYGVLPKDAAPISTRGAAQKIDEKLSVRWPEMRELLGRLATRQLTGTAARKAALNWGEALPIMQRILKKDLRCGVHAKTVNERYPDLIPTFEVALADEGFVIIGGAIVQRVDIEYPIWAEPKYDGIRTIAIVDEKEGIQLFSRKGKEFENFPHITEALKHKTLTGLMLDGEVFGETFDDVTTVAHTKKGKKDDTNLTYRVWDCMRTSEFRLGECKSKLWERQLMLSQALKGADQRVQQAPGCMIRDEAHLLDVFKTIREQGLEGLILKPVDAMYSFRRSKDWIKVKEMLTGDYKVVGFNVGKGKYAKSLGALVIRVGKVNVEVGSGFTDADRTKIWKSRKELLGCFVEVKYQEVTKDGSLRFPTFLRWRPDKDEDDPAPF